MSIIIICRFVHHRT